LQLNGKADDGDQTVSRLKRISRFWPAALALAVVSLVSGYILFLVGISPVVLQAHKACDYRWDIQYPSG